MRLTLLFIGLAVGLFTAMIGLAATIAAEDTASGEAVYKRCAGCHSLDSNRVGPAHRTVFGREAGSLEGFQFSNALKNSGIVWNEETLDKWLANPGNFVPGSRMGYRLSNAKDRAAVIEFLRAAGMAGKPHAQYRGKPNHGISR